MSDTERTTDTIIDGILGAMRQDPYEMERFVRDILTESLPLVITEQAAWDIRDVEFADYVINHAVKSWYEPDEDDAELIAEEHDIEYEDIDDQYKRDPLEPLDVWMIIPEEDNEDDVASHEANTYRDTDGEYRVAWYHTAVGLVTNEYFGTYEEAVSWYEENGYQDFTV